MCLYASVHVTVSRWSSEDSFHRGSGGDQMPVVRISGEHLGSPASGGKGEDQGGVSSGCASRNTNVGLTGVRSSGQRV